MSKPLRITNEILRHAALLSLIICCIALWKQPTSIQVTVNTPTPHTVYLTFDDGPSAVSEDVLDVLKAEGVPATFFVIGTTTEHDLSVYRRIAEEGHLLALHSYSHNPEKIYTSLENYIQDFKRLEQLIYETTGTSPKICRMVGGSHSSYCPSSIREKILSFLVEEGFACYDWDIDARDSSGYAVESNRLMTNVIRDVRKKPDQDLIILMHDDALRVTLPDALKGIIAFLKEEGYAFDVLRSDIRSKRIMSKSSD